MSLLLDALKKAELAKQHAQGDGAPVPASAAAMGLEPLTGNSVEPPTITRDRLPDITQPLEILSEDLPSAGTRRAAPPSQPPRAPEPSIPTRPAVTAVDSRNQGPATLPGAATEDHERAAVRQLFEAKTTDFNPQRPFFIVVGVLILVGLGGVGYFAYEIFSPRPAYYSTPASGRGTQPIAVAPESTATSPATASPGPSAASATPVPAPTPATEPMAISPRPGAEQTATTDKRAVTPRAAPSGLSSGADTGEADRPAGPAPAPARSISVTPAPQPIDRTLERAWTALQTGDLGTARDEYTKVLQTSPMNRYALLGLATIDVRNRDYDGAEARYMKVLEVDPRDAYAQAGIIALRGKLDPVQAESRLKNLLASQPDSSFLNFVLGNQYAAQHRWSEAQAAYFKAYAAEPENADYAFNLAVSLDQLRQAKLALQYYQRAAALAGQRAAGFDQAGIEARIRELQR